MKSNDILVSLRKIVRALQLESKNIEKMYGITIPQYLTLSHMQTCQDYQTTQRELKIFLNLNSSTVTGIISRLIKKGYIYRLPKQGDKRITHIQLTATGIKLIEQVPNVLHERLSKKLDNLPENEKNMVLQSLDIITNAMDINGVNASPMLVSNENIE